MSDALTAAAAIVEAATWVVYFRNTVPRGVLYRGQDPVSGRWVLIAHPDERRKILAGIELLGLPHELEEDL